MQHHGVETGIQKIEKEIREAEALLKKPGAFLRVTDSKLRPFEAVVPGDWTTFQSAGVEKAAFELMWKRGGLSQISPRRWILRSGASVARETDEPLLGVERAPAGDPTPDASRSQGHHPWPGPDLYGT